MATVPPAPAVVVLVVFPLFVVVILVGVFLVHQPVDSPEAPAAYVAQFFDGAAPEFDASSAALGYAIPLLLEQAVAAVAQRLAAAHSGHDDDEEEDEDEDDDGGGGDTDSNWERVAGAAGGGFGVRDGLCGAWPAARGAPRGRDPRAACSRSPRRATPRTVCPPSRPASCTCLPTKQQPQRGWRRRITSRRNPPAIVIVNVVVVVVVVVVAWHRAAHHTGAVA